jgi:hypothetical protein
VFVITSCFHTSLEFGTSPITGAIRYVLVLPTNIGLGCKWMAVTDTLLHHCSVNYHCNRYSDYYCKTFPMKVKFLEAGMGKLGKQSQLNEKKWYGANGGLSFYETRWILKFSFKHCLMNEIEIF